MIDKRGYRVSIGIIIINKDGKVFWGRRIGHNNGWQFPQGGLQPYETLQEAMFRELDEETGLVRTDVKILGVTKKWLYYQIPPHLRRYRTPGCIGQRQKWFLLLFTGDESRICLDKHGSPEFSGWEWIDYLEPINKVIYFKRRVYKLALRELEVFANQKT